MTWRIIGRFSTMPKFFDSLRAWPPSCYFFHDFSFGPDPQQKDAKSLCLCLWFVGKWNWIKNNHKVLAQFVSTFLCNNVSMFTKPIWSRFLHFGPLTWSMNLQVTTSWQMSTVGPAWWAMLPSMEHMMWGCSREGRKALSHGLSRCYQDQ